jgi:protein SCO1/2
VSAARRFAVLLGAVFALAGCQAAKPPAGTRTYSAHGVIQRISADRHVATIHHQDIAGYMPAMTMDFPVHDEHLLDGLAPGDEIDFTLAVTDDDAWVARAARTGHVALAPPAPEAEGNTLKPGDPIPDAEFLAENGQNVRFSDFRGKVVVFTFFFTRCPLPDYCPLMNRNLARARELLLADSAAPKNWQFLSISFDPDFDRPQALAGYGDFYRAHNPDRWLFVAATPATLAGFAAPLGLIVTRQDNNITHNLRTVVADPRGRLFRQFNDNRWTAGQLAAAVQAAAAAK